MLKTSTKADLIEQLEAKIKVYRRHIKSMQGYHPMDDSFYSSGTIREYRAYARSRIKIAQNQINKLKNTQ